MNSNESLPLQLKPLISYPREAQIGKTYLVSIDVQLATPEISWDFPEEEYTIGFILNTQPYFTCTPLHGESWPSIVLHRYGGTYGPAEYLFTAADHEIGSGHMSITLINGWGIPMTKLQLPCTVKLESSSIQAESREITLPVPQATTTKPEIQTQPDATPEIHAKFASTPAPEEFSIAAMLAAAGWFVVDDSDSTLDEDTITRSATGIAVRASTYNTINHVTDLDFLLLINGKVTGQITQEGASVFLTDLDEAFAERPASSIFQKISLEDRRKTLPFIYEMQGEEIHFTNNLEPEARSRIVFHFHLPETFVYWLEQAPLGTPNDLNNLLRSRLRRMPPVPETLPVAQIEAITKLEESLAQNHPRALIQMADSSSMLINSIYRLLQHGGARRILYLTKNFEETMEAYKEFMSLITADGSNWKLLDADSTERVIDDEDVSIGGGISKVTIRFRSCIIWITSVENVYHLLFNLLMEASEKPVDDKGSIEPSINYHVDLPIEFFDVIFFVECFDKLHREYRPLLDYFDAFLVGVGANIPTQAISLFNNNLMLVYKSSGISILADRPRVFISYSRKDARFLNELHAHLDHYEFTKQLEYWDDTAISPGSKWKEELQKALKATTVAILLVSADFLASEFIVNNELSSLLESARQGGVTILCIILRPCLFGNTELAQFRSVNSPSLPLSTMSRAKREAVWVETASLIKDSVQNNFGPHVEEHT